jgi:beta-galactosidase
VKEAADHFFYFDVPNVGESHLVAVSGDLKDEGDIRKVDTFNEEYRLKEKGAILNWFDIDEKEGYLSLNSKMSEIMETFRGKLALAGVFKKVMKGLQGDKKDGKKKEVAGFELTEDMMQMMGGFTLLRMTSMMGMMNVSFTKEELLKLNKKLNRIKAKKK